MDVVASIVQPAKAAESIEAQEEAKVVEVLEKKSSDVLYLEDLEQSLVDVMTAVYLTLQRTTALEAVYRLESESFLSGVS